MRIADVLASRSSVRMGVRLSDPDSSGIVDLDQLVRAHGDGLALSAARALVPLRVDPVPVAAPAVAADRGLVAWMAAAAIAAVAAIVMLAVMPSPRVVTIERAPAMVVDPEPPPAEPDAAPVVATIAAEPASIDIVIDDDEDPPASAKPVVAPRKPAKAKTASRSTSSGASSSPPKPVASPPKRDELTVECILDPKACAPAKKPIEPAAPSLAPKGEPLPDKLSAATLRAHLGPSKAEAQTCGPRHDAAKGTQVQVKLSIDGATGRIISADAQGDHASSGVGRCVADALKKATLPRFSAKQQGVVFPVRL